jgi:thiol-disulfide isomerase/thioredoxin
MMNAEPAFGSSAPRYTFILNPHTGYRASKCPLCKKATYERKFPLLILVAETHPLVLGFTCKYCSRCELILAHKDRLEDELAIAYGSLDPDVVGNDYLVVGTVDRKAWKSRLGKESEIGAVLEHASDFEKRLDLGYNPGGWRL